MAIDAGYEGFGDLGSVLLGGGADRQAAFQSGAAKAISLDSAMSVAKLKRQKLLERTQVREKLPPGPEGDLMAAIMLGEMGTDFNAATQGIGHMQENTARERALALPTPGTPDYSVDTTPDALVQAMSIAKGHLPTANNIQLGEQVHSKLGRENARAATEAARQAQLEAQTDAAHALAEARRRPKTGKGSVPTSVEGPVDGAAPEPAEAPHGKVEARKSVRGKTYIKIKGQWYEE